MSGLDALFREEFGGEVWDESLQRARDKYARMVSLRCHYGWCSSEIDPLDGKIIGGMGPVMCPCDHLPGWRSEYLAGQSRPAAPVRAKGRHGSRVQRSRQRHALPDYRALGEWLRPTSVAS